jgi:hypothetical protein
MEEEEVPTHPVVVPPQGPTVTVPPEEEVMQGLRCLRDEPFPPLQLVSSSSFLFFLKNVEPSLSRMGLFGYIVVFVDAIGHDERTIWHHAC